MTELNTYNITCLSKAVSPLTHNQGTEGNETLVATEPVQTPSGSVFVPYLTGNALRHRMIRQPGVEFLVDRLNLSGQLNLDALQFLYAGGALWKSGKTENMDRIKSMWRLFPLFRVLGGSLPDIIVGGHLDCWRGTMVCQENLDMLKQTLGDWMPEDTELMPAAEWMSKYQYTRNDPGKFYIDQLRDAEVGDRAESNQMIFSGQAVRPGAMFVHGFHLRQATSLDVGAVLLSLAIWQRDIKTIGGQSARGHGRLDVRLHLQPEVDQDKAITDYIQHIEDNRDEAVEWLAGEFEFGDLVNE